jgi:hypothetical protein
MKASRGKDGLHEERKRGNERISNGIGVITHACLLGQAVGGTDHDFRQERERECNGLAESRVVRDLHVRATRMSEDPLPRALHQHRHLGVAKTAQPRRLEDLVPVHQRTGAQLGGRRRHLVEINLKDLDVATKAGRVLRRD